MNQQTLNPTADALPPEMGLFQERWEFFKRNRMAHASALFLAALMVLAILGKVPVSAIGGISSDEAGFGIGPIFDTEDIRTRIEYGLAGQEVKP